MGGTRLACAEFLHAAIIIKVFIEMQPTARKLILTK